MTGDKRTGQDSGSHASKSRGFDMPRNAIKIDPASVMPIVTANDVVVNVADQTIFLDFSILDPALALGMIDTDAPVRKALVSRVAIGPAAAMTLLQNLAVTLSNPSNKLTLVINGQVVMSSDKEHMPQDDS